jgi:hypothetical protein
MTPAEHDRQLGLARALSEFEELLASWCTDDLSTLPVYQKGTDDPMTEPDDPLATPGEADIEAEHQLRLSEAHRRARRELHRAWHGGPCNCPGV